MDDDWASEGEEGQGFGDFAIPEVSIPSSGPNSSVIPGERYSGASGVTRGESGVRGGGSGVVNAWAASANGSGENRLAARLRSSVGGGERGRAGNAGSAGAGTGTGTGRGFHAARAQHVGRHFATAHAMGKTGAPPGMTQDEAAREAKGRGAPPGIGMPAGMVGQHHGQQARMNEGAVETVLYVTSLPGDVGEGEIAAFFGRCGVSVGDVRIIRHNDTGNIRAAFVKVRGEGNREMGLGMNGEKLGPKYVHVKIDEGDRRGGRERGYGFGRDGGNWERGGGVNVETRENKVRGGRRGVEQREDPTIPVGPVPKGRKKLVLKPRTKPMPVLEVDQRAIDGVKGNGIGGGVHGDGEKKIVGKGEVKGVHTERPNGEGWSSTLSRRGEGTGTGTGMEKASGEKWTSGSKRGEMKGVGTEKTSGGERWTSGRHGGERKGVAGEKSSGEKWTSSSSRGSGKGGMVEKQDEEKWSSSTRGGGIWGGGRGAVGARASVGKGGGHKKDEENKNRPVLLNTFAALEVNDE